MSGDFVERLARVNAQIDDRLDAVNRTIADDTQSLLGKVHDLLEGAAISQQAAADTQVTAAGAQLDAAHTPRIIRVELAAGGQVTTFDV